MFARISTSERMLVNPARLYLNRVTLRGPQQLSLIALVLKNLLVVEKLK